MVGFAVVSRAWTRGHCQDRHLGPPETSSPQYPPGSSGNSDLGDSSRNKCQDTRGTQRLLPLGGRWEWERLTLAPLNPTDSWSSSLFSLPVVPQISASWMTALGFVPKTPHFPALTSCGFLTKALPQPFRRKGSLLSKEQTSNIYCCLSWEGHRPRKNLRNARKRSVFTARVLKTRPPPWTGSFRGLQRGIVVIMYV